MDEADVLDAGVVERPDVVAPALAIEVVEPALPLLEEVRADEVASLPVSCASQAFWIWMYSAAACSRTTSGANAGSSSAASAAAASTWRWRWAVWRRAARPWLRRADQKFRVPGATLVITR